MNLQHEQDYINNAVIPPPNSSADYENYTKYTRVIIDSKDRDKSLFPQPNAYEIKLDDDIDDVINVQLLNISVQMSMYMINQYFNTFTLQINGIKYDIILDTGNYTESELATEIANKCNVVAPGNFACAYNTKLDNFIIKSKDPFTLHFETQENSLCHLLGFDTKSYASSLDASDATYTNVVKAPYRKNFAYNDYIIMCIDQFDINKSNTTDLNRSFAIIPSMYKNMNISDDPQIKKYFSPPLPRLAKLKIKFLDRFGNLYDFNNIDHHFELLFESFKQKRKYQNIFFNR